MPDRVVFCCLHSKPLNIVSAAKLWRVFRFVYRAYTSGLCTIMYVTVLHYQLVHTYGFVIPVYVPSAEKVSRVSKNTSECCW